jgi:thioredoxin-related protein
MKKTLIFLLVFTAAGFCQVQFTRLTLDSAEALAQNQNKNILIDYYTDWCVPCKELDKYIFENPEISKYINDHYVGVKVNAETRYGKVITGKLGLLEAYPTVIFLKSDGNEIDRIIGLNEPQQYFQLIKDYTKGVNTLTDLIKKDKNNGSDSLKYMIGLKLTERGKFTDAIGYYQHLVTSKKYNFDGTIYFRIGLSYAYSNDLTKAKEYANKAISKNPNEKNYKEFLDKLNSQ